MSLGKLKNVNGSTLIEIIIAFALLMIAASGVMTVGQLSNQKVTMDMARTNELSLARIIRAQIEFTDQCKDNLRFVGTHDYQVNGNNIASQPIQIRVPGLLAGVDGDWVGANSRIGTTGLVIKGLSVFNTRRIPGSTNDYLVELQMRWDYDANNDGQPDKRVMGGVTARNVDLGAMVITASGANPNNLTFDSCSGIGTVSSQEDVCESLNCSWNAGTSQCRCQTPNMGCPPGTVMTGFQGGTETCKRIGSNCPPGEYLVGVGIQAATCRPLPVYVVATVTPTATPTATPTSVGCTPDGDSFSGSLCNAGDPNISYAPTSQCCSNYARVTCGPPAEPAEITCMANPSGTPTPTPTGPCIADGQIASTVGTNCGLPFIQAGNHGPDVATPACCSGNAYRTCQPPGTPSVMMCGPPGGGPGICSCPSISEGAGYWVPCQNGSITSPGVCAVSGWKYIEGNNETGCQPRFEECTVAMPTMPSCMDDMGKVGVACGPPGSFISSSNASCCCPWGGGFVAREYRCGANGLSYATCNTAQPFPNITCQAGN